MKILLLSSLFLLIIISAFGQNPMNVITYNVRYNTAADNENSWPMRRESVINLLKSYKADILAVQEALYDQITDLKEGMAGFEYVGVGRDDGNINGEFSAIYYRSSRFQLIENGTFWLSKSPGLPSKSWDAALNRICTWAKFRDKETQKSFCIFNTHFDHKGVKARSESAILVLKKIDELAGRKDPVILTGDFNLTPEEKPMRLICQKLSDSRQISRTIPKGPLGTFNGFDFNALPENRIDYIFVNRFIMVNSYAVLNDSKNEHYPSDHFPVLVELDLINR